LRKLEIIVNGKKKTIDCNVTLIDLLNGMKFYPETVVISLNDVIVDRNDYGMKTLKNNDSVEIIRFMSGG